MNKKSGQQIKNATVKPAFSLSQSGLLQRTCECGGVPGLTGQCEECSSKRLSRQRQANSPALPHSPPDNPSILPIQRAKLGGYSFGKIAIAPKERFGIQAKSAKGEIVQKQETPSPTPLKSEPASSDIPPIVHEVLNSPGQPLDRGTRTFMESRFGYDFSAVKVHTDTKAEKSAQAVNALAYTVGNNIAFAPSAYRLDTPAGLHLLAHELSHVVQQGGAAAKLEPSQNIAPTNDPLEQEADRTADAILRGEFVSPHRLGISQVARLQRAVSKVCNPPSVWFVLGGPQNLPAAQAFGAIAEAFISADVVLRNGVALGNFYLDNPLAGPIDPLLVAFIIAKNPGMSLLNKLALAAAAVARPDVLMHQGTLTEFEEVKPNSVAGRAAGRTKVSFLSGFYSSLSLPYTAGTTYTPHPPFVIASGIIPGTTTPITITFETTRDRNGLLVYDICVETDWLVASLAAIAIVIAIILLLLLAGAIGPVPIPAPALAAAGGTAGEAVAATETEKSSLA